MTDTMDTRCEHTPGPWEVRGEFIGPLLAPDSGILLKVARISGGATDEARANSNLIAAAPDYKAARDSLFDAIKHGDDEHQNWLRLAIDDHFHLADAKAQPTLETPHG